MEEKTIFKRKLDDFKTKNNHNYLTISIVTNGKNEIKRQILSEKTSSAQEFWRNVYVCGLPMRKKILKTIHYGLRKGNKKIVTFATINNTKNI